MWPFKKKPLPTTLGSAVQGTCPVRIDDFKVQGRIMPSTDDPRWRPYYFIPSSRCYQLEDKGVRLVLYRWGNSTYTLNSNGVEVAGNEIKPYYDAVNERFVKAAEEYGARQREEAINAIGIVSGID